MVTGAENVVPKEPFRANRESKMSSKSPLWEPLGAKGSQKVLKVPPEGFCMQKGDIVNT